MTHPPKVFISYASSDGGGLAARLRTDLASAGADVFQFEGTARPGDTAWGQVVRNIAGADWFVALVTANAVASKPVGYEIEHAVHTWVNSEDNRPSIVPILVHDVATPDLLKTLTPLEYTDPDECSRALRVLLKLEQTGARPAPSHAEALGCILVAAPRRSQVGNAVYWSAAAENQSGSRLRDVVLRLDTSIVAGPADLAPGENLTAEVPVVYDAPGTRRRTLVITATDGRGNQVSASAERTVKVEAASSPTEQSRPQTRLTVDRDRLQKLLQGSASSGRTRSPTAFPVPSRTGQMLSTLKHSAKQQPPPGSAPVALHRGGDGVLPSGDFGSGAGSMLAGAMAAGVALAVAAFFAVRAFLDYMSNADVPDLLLLVPEVFGGWSAWARLLIGIAVLVILIFVGARRTEDVIVVDVLDSLNAGFTAGLVGVAAAVLWAYVSLEAMNSSALAWLGVGAVAATTAGVAGSIALDELG